MPAKKKKSSKTRVRKAARSKSTGKKAASRKPSAKRAAPAKGARVEARSSTPKPPKLGAKEEHYADLRRVALANALARLR